MWYITCISSWKQRLGAIGFSFCLSLRAGRAWWLSVGSGGRPLADIWLSSVLAVSPLASSFTFLRLHFCICTMGQVIIVTSESRCEVWVNECPKSTNRRVWCTVPPQYASLILTPSQPLGVLCTLMMSLSLSGVNVSGYLLISYCGCRGLHSYWKGMLLQPRNRNGVEPLSAPPALTLSFLWALC